MLLLLAVIISTIWFIISAIIKAIKRKPLLQPIKKMGIVWICYLLLWCIFFFKSTYKTVEYGTPVCFDDWCATVTKTEIVKSIAAKSADGEFVIVHLKMMNRARGRAQKPSEPAVYILNANGNKTSVSPTGTKALEESIGKQAPLDAELDLHGELETQLVFDVPANNRDLKVLIEEGPFISKLELWGDREVFEVRTNKQLK